MVSFPLVLIPFIMGLCFIDAFTAVTRQTPAGLNGHLRQNHFLLVNPADFICGEVSCHFLKAPIQYRREDVAQVM